MTASLSHDLCIFTSEFNTTSNLHNITLSMVIIQFRLINFFCSYYVKLIKECYRVRNGNLSRKI